MTVGAFRPPEGRNGRQVLVTNWCAPPDEGGIFSEVAQASDARRVHPINATRNNREYGISFTARRDMFMLPNIAHTSPRSKSRAPIPTATP